MLAPVWNQLKQQFAPNTPTDVKLKLYMFWFNGEYTNHVIRPEFEHMRISAESIADKKTLTHITSSQAFKNNALYYLATQFPQTRLVDIGNDLQQLIKQANPINVESPPTTQQEQSPFD